MMLVIISLAAFVLVLACLSCTLLICAEKWRVIEFYELHIKGRKIFGKRIGELCTFCFGFWISVVITIAAYFSLDVQGLYFIAPLASASLTRYLYEGITTKTR